MTPDRRTFLATLAAALAAPGVARAATLDVVATTGMIADAATRIGGARVAVTGLMGPGVDPHSYRQTRSDIVAMTRAGLVLWHGLYLEAQLEEFLLDLARSRTVAAVGEAVPRADLIAHADYADRFDPHVWMVPDLWRHVIGAVAEALVAADPEGEAEYRERAAAFMAEAAGLQAYAAGVLATIPPERRVLVTAHDAFGYFGRAFGLEVAGIQGISTASEAGLQRIEEVVDLIVARGIGAVFVESSVSDRNMRALIEGAAARGHTVAIGGELFSDAMGQPGSYEGTWTGMIDHNATLIARALGGEAPPRGWQGRLMAEG